MWMLYLALGIGLLYAVLAIVVASAQTKLLFPVEMAAANRPARPSGAERLEVKTADGHQLVGVRLGRSSPDPAQPLLLGFGGNAWNADMMALYLRTLFPEAEVVTFHYRGYPPSGGHPSAAALLEDAVTVFDHLQRERPQPVIAIGFSIGSGVAAYLARQRPLAGQILVTPFDSLRSLAGDHFPWAPVSLLLRHRIDTAEYLRGNRTPAALIAAGRDTIVPARRSSPLREAAPNLVFDRIIAEAGHNDLYDRPAFRQAMHEAVTRITATGRPLPPS
jgi:pimeloyl-ACP methyl ester carboxylesterase